MESWEWQGELNRSPFEWYEEEITQDYVVLFHQSVIYIERFNRVCISILSFHA